MRYAPGTYQAQFNVTFTFVGSGAGDYANVLLGDYRYVGPHNGNYSPIIILPAPQLQQIADVNTSIHLMKDLSVSGEFAASNLNPNRFAANDEITGDATKFSANFAPANVKVGGANIGSFNLSLSDRYTNKNFSPLDRIDDVEFGREWSIDSTVTIQPSSGKKSGKRTRVRSYPDAFSRRVDWIKRHGITVLGKSQRGLRAPR